MKDIMMGLVRLYQLVGSPATSDALRTAIRALEDQLKSIPGFVGSELLRDGENPNRFYFIERWASLEAYEEGSKLLGKEAFANLMATLADKPIATSLFPSS